jgi:sigma-B regulation protein RsbU (phosphoserine phosphatase)
LKLVLVSPKGPLYRHRGGIFKKSLRYSPLTLVTLAAYVPHELGAQITILDEGIEDMPERLEADLVAMTVITGSANRSYELAKRYRDQGIPVVLGGPHVTLVPDDAAPHADAIVTGYAEHTWPQLLRDFAAGRMKARYDQGELDLSGLPLPRRDLLKAYNYTTTNVFEATRGCVHDCDFCVVPAAWGRRPYQKPVEDVVREIRAVGAKKAIFVDLNLIADKTYARKLFDALTPLGLQWFGLATSLLQHDLDLLERMARSGCKGLLVGLESVNQLALEHAANELADRYEEINLLYAIGEFFGRAVTLEETAATILTEVSETVGARRGSILLFDRVTGTLQAVAVLGAAPEAVPPIDVNDETSVSAFVFRELHPVIADRDAPPCPAEEAYRRGEMLSVPILWGTPQGNEPLGVVNLSDRGGRHSFTAGDLKLVAAIASQIAAAIQNARLVRASMQQQRLSQEMALAHDLQMKLLPSVDAVSPTARVAARVVPAESVGGDFYHLFRVGDDRVGVMIGDVSGHGYRAALIMALAMSASAIHAQGTADPGATLGAVLRSLREELSSTEMFISTLYAVIDPTRGVLRYANAGHPHAFVLRDTGEVERLVATAPPLGMVDAAPATVTLPWTPDADLLLLFTDGVSDARDRAGARLGEEPVVDAARAAAAEPPDELLRRVFDRLDAHVGDAPQRDDLTVVVVRS